MKVSRIGNCNEFASFCPEDLPEYLFHYKIPSLSVSTPKAKAEPVQPSKTKLECLNYQLNS